MKAKTNTQDVEVYRIRIDYIKPGHEWVQLLIEYYNAIPARDGNGVGTGFAIPYQSS